MDVKKAIIIGIVVSGIIIGVFVGLSFDSFSIIEGNDLSSEPISGNEGEDSDRVSKPPGRDLTIELEEKMGLTAP